MTEKKYIITESQLRELEIQWTVMGKEKVTLKFPLAPDMAERCSKCELLNKYKKQLEKDALRLDAIKAEIKERIEKNSQRYLETSNDSFGDIADELREILALLEREG